MRWYRNTTILGGLLSLCLYACGPKKPLVIDPNYTARVERDLKDVASTSRLELHLTGWREAEAYIEEVHLQSLHGTTPDKLQITRFLLLAREVEEGIYNPDQIERLTSLCRSSSSKFHRILCRSARQRLQVAGHIKDESVRDPIPCGAFIVPEGIDPLLAAYLYLLVTPNSHDCGYAKKARTILDRAETSTLSLYLTLEKLDLRKCTTFLERHPRFAELFLRQGQLFLKSKQFTLGIESIERAIHLVPDYTKALNALGNSHMFTFHLYERALFYFDVVLHWDPDNIPALFGRGVALQSLGRYGDSQETFDRLLDSDANRWKPFSETRQAFYRGQTCYYKANNCYLMGVSEAARDWVDRALNYLPHLKPALYLSGILHFEEDRFAEARSEFLRVIDGATDICDAYFRIGVIDHSGEPKREILYNFMNNAYCLERRIRKLHKELAQVHDLDLDDRRAEEVASSLRIRLDRLHNKTFASLLNMITRAGSMSAFDTSVFIRSMEELWERLKQKGIPD